MCAKLCNRLATVSPIMLKKTILLPLIAPILNISATNTSPDSKVISTEASVERSVVLVLQLLSLAPPERKLLELLIRTGYIFALLSLHGYLISEDKVSGLLSPCRMICRLFLDRDPSLSGIADEILRAMLQSSENKFVPGGSGGVEIKRGCSIEPDKSNPLLGSIKYQLSSLQPPSSSQLNKESFDQLVALCMEQLEHDIDSPDIVDSTSKLSISQTKHSLNSFSISRAVSIASALGDICDLNSLDKSSKRTGDFNSASNLISNIFIRGLSGYLTPQTENSAADNAPNMSIRNANSKIREQSGIVLLALQSTLPMPMLLSDGEKIINVLKLVFDSQSLLLNSVDVTNIPSKDNNTDNLSSGHKPLIEDITNQNSGARDFERVKEEPVKVTTSLMEPPVDSYGISEDNEFLSTALSMLSTMLAYGTASRPDTEESALRSLLPSLQLIASLHLDSTIAEACTDTAVAIMTRGVPAKAMSIIAPQQGMSRGISTISGINSMNTADSTPLVGSNIIETCNAASKELLLDQHPAIRSLGVRHINTALKQSKTVCMGILETL